MSLSRVGSANHPLLVAKAATGIGNVVRISEYQLVTIDVNTDGGGNAALTVKFQISSSDTKPDFTAAQSSTNSWKYAQVIDTSNGDIIDGEDGVIAASADVYRQFELNQNNSTWFCAIVTARTQGSVTVGVKLANNQ